jgi:hypothetical protein
VTTTTSGWLDESIMEVNKNFLDMTSFSQVEEWLTEEEKKTRNNPNTGESCKLIEAESENRSLRSALVEAQMKATLLQTQLTQKRSEYQELVHEFHS